MSDTSYEENIAKRLRERIDGTFLDKAAADVIDDLLGEVAALKSALSVAKEDAEADRIDNSQFGVGA